MIVPLNKGKGEMTEFKNYRGISLLRRWMFSEKEN